MSDESADQGLVVEDSIDLLLLLLYAPGKADVSAEPVEGATRIQKLMFLLQNQTDLPDLVAQAKEVLDYVPHKMGPYSFELKDAINELQAAGIIEADSLQYTLNDDSDGAETEDDDASDGEVRARTVESYRYRLSELGKNIAKGLWDSLRDEQQNELGEFKRFFNSLTLRQLLIFTYKKFPKFTTASTIKKELGFEE